MSIAEYAVVDVETTGLFPGRHDRVVEIGVVLLDRNGVAVDEWCSLVNPGRDLGPQHIHGIRASEVREAPTFADIAGDLAQRLIGHVVVAHNLSFDIRFLSAEYHRIGAHVPLGYDRGICTMGLSDTYLHNAARSLAACCASAGIDHHNAHSALHDARACAGLLAHFIRATSRPEPWSDLLAAARYDVWPELPPGCGRTCARQSADAQPMAFLARLIDRLPRVQYPPRADDYLALLDRALLDRHLSSSEQDALIEVAQALDLTVTDAMELHRQYLAALAAVAWQDGVVTVGERDDLLTVAELLGLTAQDVDIVERIAKESRDSTPWGKFSLKPGDLIAFTGQMTGLRDDWEQRATKHGLKIAENSLTKTTRLLVAADPDSLSGKASKARRYGIPIVTTQAFEKLLEQM
jgi:DNA polymerase-3 subunit epsilon